VKPCTNVTHWEVDCRAAELPPEQWCTNCRLTYRLDIDADSARRLWLELRQWLSTLDQHSS
jgi:hypothetical protein